MANGELLKEIDELVKEDKIKPDVAMRLILLSVQRLLDGQEVALKERQAVRHTSVVRVSFFLDRHPKLAFSLLAAFLSILILPHAAETWTWIVAIVAQYIITP